LTLTFFDLVNIIAPFSKLSNHFEGVVTIALEKAAKALQQLPTVSPEGGKFMAEGFATSRENYKRSRTEDNRGRTLTKLCTKLTNSGSSVR
jgi:hypothetical protein